MILRLAVVVSHPIQYFAPWHREVARLGEVDLRVYFCCDWGLTEYLDPGFQVSFKWDIPLLDGYAYEFLPIASRPQRLSFWEVDNPQVEEALDRFLPDVVQVFGYVYRTNWRVAEWAHRRRKPLLLYSDSNATARRPWWKQVAKQMVVRHFYNRVDGALYVGDNNLAYHLMYGLPRERLFAGAFPIDRQRLLKPIADREAIRRAVRLRHSIPPEAFIIMFCGKYIRHKRPLDLVAAAWAAAQTGLPIWSMLVGEGEERAAIEEFCQRERVTNVVLTGFVNQSNMPQYYVASDAIALTSSHEPYGLVISEGATFGLPAIVSDQVGCIGTNDIAQPGINAIVYPCGNRDRLRQAIEDLYKDRNLYSRMSNASVQISERQDVTLVAKALAAAAYELHRIGPR